MSGELLNAALGPELIHARRTESLDAPDILKLAGSVTENLFGRVNIVHIIEKANLAVTLVNSGNEVVAHAAFFDYPNITNVDQSKWEEWLTSRYDCKKASPLNSLFMNYFVAKPEFASGCAREFIRTVFDAVPSSYYVFLVIPKEVETVPVLSDIFKPVKFDEDFSGKLTHEVQVCYRHDHCPSLHIRPARVEDHDDLTPIFNKQSDVLTSTYGDYFLNELIEAQDDVNKCIVADVNGTAVGFMSVSSDVNTGLLTDCFNLRPFNGLRRLPEDHVSSDEKEETVEEGSGSAHSDSKSSRSESATSVKKTGTDDTLTPRSSAKSVRESKNESGAEKEQEKEKEAKKKPKTSEEKKKDKTKSSKTELQPSKKSGGEETRSPSIRKKSDKQSKGDSNVEKEKDSKKKHKSSEKRKKESAPPSVSKHTQTEYSDDEEFNPIFAGEKSAICIQLFCIDEKYEMRSIDFLPTAFELFPDKDYCVLTMPHTVPEFPLLQAFARATPRKYSTLSQELYVFHRWGLDGSFQVRPCTSDDTAGIKNIVKKLKGSQQILDDITQCNSARRDDDGTEIQAFVAESMKQVVGVAVLRREEDIEYIRSHYNIEDYVYFNHHQREEHAHLHHFCLNPVFQQYSKHFLKEVLRLSHKSCLYYPIYPKYKIDKGEKPHTTVTALNDLVPIKARRQIVYPTEELKGNEPSERVLQKKDPFSLCHVNRKLTLEPKVAINARIVVVGASDVGVSFLEAFVFCPHLRFNNVTVISPHGLPGQLEPDPIRSQFLPSSRCYSEEDHVFMSLRTWVNVVEGKMLGIDRTNKIVRVSEGHKVPYDYLVLCTGQQFAIPVPTGAEIDTLVTTSEVEPPKSSVYKGTLPSNVLTLNSDKEADIVLTWIRQQFLNSQGNAVVYGATFEAYTMVQGMLAAGVPGRRIHLVQPPQSIPSCFNNADIEEAVAIALKDEGVTVHTGFTLATWNNGNVDEPVQFATFTSDNKPLKVDCEVFFCFQERRVDNYAFKAINDSCLVYDGKLVVDASFNTNDPCIRAAGPLTKYARKYHTESWTHANFNSKEVGSQLAKYLLMLFDPTLEGILPDMMQEDQKLITSYKKPKIVSAILPGRYNYLHIGKPGLNLPLDSLMVQPEFGRELVTGSAREAKDGQGYFRLHINQYKNVETITCYTTKSLDASNLICLYGIHERYLNNLLQRFDEGLINNFYSFFRETWCHALFHDRFVDLREEAREVLVAKPIPDAPSLDEKVKKMIEEDVTDAKSEPNAEETNEEAEEKSDTAEEKDETFEEKDGTSEEKDETAEEKNEAAEEKNETAEENNEKAEEKNESAEEKNETAEEKNELAEEKNETAEEIENLKIDPETLKPIQEAIVRYMGRDSWNEIEGSLGNLVSPGELSKFVGANLDSQDFAKFLAKLVGSSSSSKEKNKDTCNGNTFSLQDVKGFLCFEASLMQTKDFLAKHPEKNGAFLTIKCIGPDETMESAEHLTKEACKLAQLVNYPNATVFNVCIVSEAKFASLVEKALEEKGVPITSGYICVQGCKSKDRLSLASSVKTFNVGHWSVSGQKLPFHYNFKEGEQLDNFITVESDEGSEALPENGYAWLISHFSHPNDFVIETGSKIGKGFCTALKGGRNAFLVNAEKDEENADRIRYMLVDPGATAYTGGRLRGVSSKEGDRTATVELPQLQLVPSANVRKARDGGMTLFGTAYPV